MMAPLFILLRNCAASCLAVALVAALVSPRPGFAQEPAHKSAHEPTQPAEQFPPPVEEPEAQTDPFGGLYLVGGLSVGGIEDAWADAGFEVEYGFEAGIDFGVGYAAGPFRIEAVLLAHRAEVFDINPASGSGIPAVQYGGWLDLGGIMANAFFDFDLSPRLKPYVGAGFGYGYVEAVYSETDCVFACALDNDLVDADDTVRLWQGMVGLSIRQREGSAGIVFYTGYRYLRGEDMQFHLTDGTPFEQDGLRAHILEAGLRLHFP